MKKIVYIGVDNGIDGRERDQILYAAWKEDELLKLHKSDKSKNLRTCSEIIVDVEKAKKEALAKLNGVDRLVLGLEDWITEHYQK